MTYPLSSSAQSNKAVWVELEFVYPRCLLLRACRRYMSANFPKWTQLNSSPYTD